jgi:hypothetical protein
MKHFWRKKTYIFLLIFITGVFFLSSVVLTVLSKYLSKSNKIRANILIVEGWIPTELLKQATKELKSEDCELIITTGLSYPDYCQLACNGNLVFYPTTYLPFSVPNTFNSIGINAYGELGNPNLAHFNVLVNNNIIGNFFATKQKSVYKLNWVGKLSDIDSVTIQFDNDKIGKFGDINLYVNQLIINDTIKINAHFNSIYRITDPFNRKTIKYNYSNYADIARNTLLDMGMDSSKVIAVSGGAVTINRTYASAMAVKKWISTSNIKIEGINILSMGLHARRTNFIYNKVLSKEYRLGIISLPDYSLGQSRKTRYLKTIRELVGNVYYWVILK